MADVSLFFSEEPSQRTAPSDLTRTEKKEGNSNQFHDLLVSTNDLINLCGVPSIYRNYVTMD